MAPPLVLWHTVTVGKKMTQRTELQAYCKFGKVNTERPHELIYELDQIS